MIWFFEMDRNLNSLDHTFEIYLESIDHQLQTEFKGHYGTLLV